LLEVSVPYARQRVSPRVPRPGWRLPFGIEFDFLSLVLHESSGPDHAPPHSRNKIFYRKADRGGFYLWQDSPRGHTSGWVGKRRSLRHPRCREKRDSRIVCRAFAKQQCSFLAFFPSTTAQRRIGSMASAVWCGSKSRTPDSIMQRVASRLAVGRRDNTLNLETSRPTIATRAASATASRSLEINKSCDHQPRIPELFRGIVHISSGHSPDYTSAATRFKQAAQDYSLDFPAKRISSSGDGGSARASPVAVYHRRRGGRRLARGSELGRFDTEVIRILRARAFKPLLIPVDPSRPYLRSSIRERGRFLTPEGR